MTTWAFGSDLAGHGHDIDLCRGAALERQPSEYGNAIAEYEQFFALGVDGVFSDNADTAKAARDAE